MKLARSIFEHYPTFEDAGAFLDAPESWHGRISPFGRCPASDIPLIVDDLHAGLGVHVQEGGLLHDPRCARDHSVVRFMSAVAGIDRETFSIRLLVPAPPVHPKIIAIYPEISARTFPAHPHLFRTTRPDVPELRQLNPALHRQLLARSLPELPKLMSDALCTYRPGDCEWSWETSDLVDCLDFAALFLAKHAIWVRTGAHERAVWLGPQASHDPIDMIKELDPDGECRCGRGRTYRLCCRPQDELCAQIVSQLRASRVARHAA